MQKYNIEGSSGFIVDARGSPQRWLLSGENKSLGTFGIVAIVVGTIVLAGGLMIDDLATLQKQTGGYNPQGSSSGLLIAGGIALDVSGVIGWLLARPHATRIE